MDGDFGFGMFMGWMLGVATVCFIALLASSGTGAVYNELEIELACRQEFGQSVVASSSAQVCPILMDRLEANDKDK